ncbi:MAG: hypothetical protein U5K32_12890 [Bacteroidales bacterium]|nr:hypothetical protein [Bacteroidales bacterium]
MKNKKSVKIDAMELQTVDGKEVTIERTEGEPEVGDKATPDGTHKMEGGQTIVVKKE